MTIRRSISVSKVERPEVSCSGVDYYVWLQGGESDKFMHKIGLCNGKPIVEKIDDRVVRLTESESCYFDKIIHQNNTPKGE